MSNSGNEHTNLISEAVNTCIPARPTGTGTEENGGTTTLNESNDDEPGEKVLRIGSCWCDPKENCRKKKEGKTCDERKRCPANGCVVLVATATGTIIKIISLF